MSDEPQTHFAGPKTFDVIQRCQKLLGEGELTAMRGHWQWTQKKINPDTCATFDVVSLGGDVDEALATLDELEREAPGEVITQIGLTIDELDELAETIANYHEMLMKRLGDAVLAAELTKTLQASLMFNVPAPGINVSTPGIMIIEPDTPGIEVDDPT